MNKEKVFAAINEFSKNCEDSYKLFIDHRGNQKYIANINEHALALKEELSESNLSTGCAKLFNEFIKEFIPLLAVQLTEIVSTGSGEKGKAKIISLSISAIKEDVGKGFTPGFAYAMHIFTILAANLYNLVEVNRALILECGKLSKPVIDDVPEASKSSNPKPGKP